MKKVTRIAYRVSSIAYCVKKINGLWPIEICRNIVEINRYMLRYIDSPLLENILKYS